MQPEDAEMQYLLGNTYLMAGKYDEAIKTLNKVLVLNPDHVDARDRLRAASARKNLLPQLELFKQRVADEPLSAEAHAQLGQGYNGLGLFAEAEAVYLKAIALDPKSWEIYNRMAINYSEWGKFEKAVEYYNKAIGLKPNHVLYLGMGRAYEKQGKIDDAITAYQMSIEIKPKFTQGLYSLASLYLYQDRPQEAIDLLRRLLEVEPRNVFANHALGLAYLNTGNKTGAMQQYYILQNLNPNVAAQLLNQIPK